jgi:hypothetical protein
MWGKYKSDGQFKEKVDAAFAGRTQKLALAESCLTGPCGRSRLLVTGGGRAGKTSLCRSLQNKDFQQTDSTPGIESTTLEVSIDRIAVREGGREREERGKAWSAHERPKKEMEFLLARVVHEKEKEKRKTVTETETEPRRKQEQKKEGEGGREANQVQITEESPVSKPQTAGSQNENRTANTVPKRSAGGPFLSCMNFCLTYCPFILTIYLLF